MKHTVVALRCLSLAFPLCPAGAAEITPTKCEGLSEKTWRVPPEFFATLAARSKLGIAKAKQVLEANGVQFGPGASASYDATTDLLTVRNARELVGLVDAFIAQFDAWPDAK